MNIAKLIVNPVRSTKTMTADGFHVGDKILCVDDSGTSHLPTPLIKGRIYCVRGLLTCEHCNHHSLYIVGITLHTPPKMKCSKCKLIIVTREKAFRANRFVLASRQMS